MSEDEGGFVEVGRANEPRCRDLLDRLHITLLEWMEEGSWSVTDVMAATNSFFLNCVRNCAVEMMARESEPVRHAIWERIWAMARATFLKNSLEAESDTNEVFES